MRSESSTTDYDMVNELIGGMIDTEAGQYGGFGDAYIGKTIEELQEGVVAITDFLLHNKFTIDHEKIINLAMYLHTTFSDYLNGADIMAYGDDRGNNWMHAYTLFVWYFSETYDHYNKFKYSYNETTYPSFAGLYLQLTTLLLKVANHRDNNIKDNVARLLNAHNRFSHYPIDYMIIPLLRYAEDDNRKIIKNTYNYILAAGYNVNLPGSDTNTHVHKIMFIYEAFNIKVNEEKTDLKREYNYDDVLINYITNLYDIPSGTGTGTGWFSSSLPNNPRSMDRLERNDLDNMNQAKNWMISRIMKGGYQETTQNSHGYCIAPEAEGVPAGEDPAVPVDKDEGAAVTGGSDQNQQGWGESINDISFPITENTFTDFNTKKNDSDGPRSHAKGGYSSTSMTGGSTTAQVTGFLNSIFGKQQGGGRSGSKTIRGYRSLNTGYKQTGGAHANTSDTDSDISEEEKNECKEQVNKTLNKIAKLTNLDINDKKNKNLAYEYKKEVMRQLKNDDEFMKLNTQISKEKYLEKKLTKKMLANAADNTQNHKLQRLLKSNKKTPVSETSDSDLTSSMTESMTGGSFSATSDYTSLDGYMPYSSARQSTTYDSEW